MDFEEKLTLISKALEGLTKSRDDEKIIVEVMPSEYDGYIVKIKSSDKLIGMIKASPNMFVTSISLDYPDLESICSELEKGWHS